MNQESSRTPKVKLRTTLRSQSSVTKAQRPARTGSPAVLLDASGANSAATIAWSSTATVEGQQSMRASSSSASNISNIPATPHGTSTPVRCRRKPVPTLVSSSSQDDVSPAGGLILPTLRNNESSTNERAKAALTKDVLHSLGSDLDDEHTIRILQDIVQNESGVYWTDIVGLEVAKATLRETVIYPLARPDLFSHGLREPARGILLFGPPGTGKTMLAQAVATEARCTFFSVTASTLNNKYVGESEKTVRALFQVAKKMAPSIIFVDEVDSLLSSRNENEHGSSLRVKTEFLIQWNDLARATAMRNPRETKAQEDKQVLVLAATNMPWMLDEAVRRRFVRRQYISLPEKETRKAHIASALCNQHHTLLDIDLNELATITNGFSGSDLTSLCRDAAMQPLRCLGDAILSTPLDMIRPITIADFKLSLKSIRPSVDIAQLERFSEWSSKYGEMGA